MEKYAPELEGPEGFGLRAKRPASKQICLQNQYLLDTRWYTVLNASLVTPIHGHKQTHALLTVSIPSPFCSSFALLLSFFRSFFLLGFLPLSYDTAAVSPSTFRRDLAANVERGSGIDGLRSAGDIYSWRGDRSRDYFYRNKERDDSRLE